MMRIVFFLEEPSAREMIEGLLPRILSGIHPLFIVFQGKQDMEKRLPRYLKSWQVPEDLFVIMRDKDSEDCIVVKNRLVDMCRKANKPDALVRIACHELESFYLGDLSAVAEAIGPANIGDKQNKVKFRDPDRLANPKEELKKIAPAYQPISGSRAIGALLDVEKNRSTSFNALVSGMRNLMEGKQMKIRLF